MWVHLLGIQASFSPTGTIPALSSGGLSFTQDSPPWALESRMNIKVAMCPLLYRKSGPLSPFPSSAAGCASNSKQKRIKDRNGTWWQMKQDDGMESPLELRTKPPLLCPLGQTQRPDHLMRAQGVITGQYKNLKPGPSMENWKRRRMKVGDA